MDEQQVIENLRQIQRTEYQDPDIALAIANEIGEMLPQLSTETRAFAEDIIQELTHVIIDLRTAQKNREKA